MLKNKKTVYFCQECGYESAKWMGQCPGCKAWNTFVEEKAPELPGGSYGSADPKARPVKLEDIIRSEMESAPRHIKISEDGRYIYILHELKCYIDVYEYADHDNDPTFEKIQTVELIKLTRGNTNSASAFSFSLDYNYLLSSIAGDNSVIVFDVDKKTGLLKKNFLLPVSGEYPKDAEFFPDNKFLVSLNHESNTMTFFHIDLEHGTMIMNGPAMKVNMPNCIVFHKLG